MTAIDLYRIIPAIAVHTFSVEVETLKPIGGEAYPRCDYCNGSGRVTCYTCDGRGRVLEGYFHECENDWIETGRVTCPDCDGSGNVDCEECDGESGGWEGNGDYPHWDYKEDGSCGYEAIISKVDIYHLLKWRYELSRDLADAQINHLCGGHVHVDWQAVTRDYEHHTDVLKTVLAIIHRLGHDRWMWEKMGINEKRTNGTYGYRQGMQYDFRSSTVAAFVENALYRYSAGTRLEHNRAYIHGCGVNSGARNYKNTWEFRIFDSPNSWEQLTRNALWALSLVQIAVDMTRSDRDAWEHVAEFDREELYNLITDTASKAYEVLINDVPLETVADMQA